jgi:hypothetical protein
VLLVTHAVGRMFVTYLAVFNISEPVVSKEVLSVPILMYVYPSVQPRVPQQLLILVQQLERQQILIPVTLQLLQPDGVDRLFVHKHGVVM